MTRARAVIFGALVAATFGAFFVAQAVKSSPSVIQQLTFSPVFSPNKDGRKERLRINFKLKEADDVTVTMLDADGDAVRTLLDDAPIEAYSPLDPSLAWDGRDDAGRRVLDGRYRIRLTLRRQGRSVVLPRSILKDTEPPRPLIASIGPEKGLGPEILPRPGGGAATVRFGKALAKGRVLVFKTGPGRPRLSFEEPLEAGATRFFWDGTHNGRAVSPGTYLTVVEWRDRAGNVGTSAPLDADGLPRLGRPLPGRGGITVRYLGAQPPSEAVKAREPVTVCIDARRKRYRWAIRRIGTPRPLKRGRGTRPCVTTRAPGGVSGAYLFEVRTRTRATRVVFGVQSRKDPVGTKAKPRGVLVVLPVMTWQGRNSADDDGDGAPNLLESRTTAKLARIYAGDGLPAGFAQHEAPMVGWLDRTGRRYDLTTDVALLRGSGPKLTGHKGVLIPGEARWLPARVRAGLRDFARRGGTVMSLGTDSLLRTIGVTQRGTMVRPSRRRPTDLFGARLRPVVRKPVALTNFQDDIRFFEGTEGVFSNVTAWEETAAAGQEADLVARAVTPEGKNVIVAARYGRGLIIRPGIPDFPTRLTPDPAIRALMERSWTLLSR